MTVPSVPVAEQTRVMICDDSAVVRSAIARILERDPAIRVVARVADGAQAVEKIGTTPVDVVVLDVEMPVMDGLTALGHLLARDPGLRIVMASSLTRRGADIALQALRLGAADYVPKPSATPLADDAGFGPELVEKVKGLGRMRRKAVTPVQAAAAHLAPAPSRPPALLAIGSSTGGPQALFSLVQALGHVRVPVVLTQHMPSTFTPLLARHLSRLGGMECTEAEDGTVLLPGHIYLAPGDHHLVIQKDNGVLHARVSDGPPENHCRPAVDVMLRSACAACNGAVLVVMLTGMGQDGLIGTELIVRAGGAAIAQDAATSVVWGMPGAIARAGLAHAVLPLSRIAPKVLDLLASR